MEAQSGTEINQYFAPRVTVMVDADVTPLRRKLRRVLRDLQDLNRELAQFQAGLLGQSERLREFGIDLVIGDEE